MQKQSYINLAKTFALVLVIYSAPSCRTTESTSEEKAVFDANGQKIPDAQAGGARTAWRALDKNTDGITGVGVLNATIVFTNQDICTAFLVDSGNDDGPAYVLTNSHCTFFKHWGFDRLKATEHRVDQPVSSHFVMFNHFVDVPEKQRVSFKLKKVTYMTEYGTDVALLEVNATLKTLKDQGIIPLKLSATRPATGEAVRLIGVPLFHVSWSRNSLHISSCTVGRNAVIENGIYKAPESVAHQCSSVEGFSGGPLISIATGEVVLLNSHGAADSSSGDAPCTYATRPCEVLSNGTKKVWNDLNFAQYVDGISGCFAATGIFDLARTECKLPK
jgi:hypothetical protein